jgi:hypothetical protein
MMTIACYYGMVNGGDRLLGRFCDCEPIGIIFKNIIARLVGCLKFGLYLNWFESMLLS